MVEYTTVQYACYDKYPKGESFVTDMQLFQLAQQEIKQDGLKGELSASNKYKDLKAAFRVDSIWKQPELHIAFMDGNDKQKNWVMKIIKENLEPLCSKIKFIWNAPIEKSDIRVSFRLPRQAWSTVGTDAKKVPVTQPTMNFGWLDDDLQFNAPKYKNTGQVVMHEFGHAMGMIHEHQNPKSNPIVWNKDVVYAELQRTNGWTKQQTDHNMFAKYGDAQLCEEAKAMPKGSERRIAMEEYCSGQLINGSEYDVTSVMHYFYPPSWILEGPTEIPINLTYSPLDKKWLRKYYGVELPEESPNVMKVKEGFAFFDSNLIRRNLFFIILLLIILAFVIAYLTILQN